MTNAWFMGCFVREWNEVLNPFPKRRWVESNSAPLIFWWWMCTNLEVQRYHFLVRLVNPTFTIIFGSRGEFIIDSKRSFSILKMVACRLPGYSHPMDPDLWEAPPRSHRSQWVKINVTLPGGWKFRDTNAQHGKGCWQAHGIHVWYVYLSTYCLFVW